MRDNFSAFLDTINVINPAITLKMYLKPHNYCLKLFIVDVNLMSDSFSGFLTTKPGQDNENVHPDVTNTVYILT